MGDCKQRSCDDDSEAEFDYRRMMNLAEAMMTGENRLSQPPEGNLFEHGIDNHEVEPVKPACGRIAGGSRDEAIDNQNDKEQRQHRRKILREAVDISVFY